MVGYFYREDQKPSPPPNVETIIKDSIIRDSIYIINDSIRTEILYLEQKYDKETTAIMSSSDSVNLEFFKEYIENFMKNNKTELFITKARKVHKDKYDYSKVEYVNWNTPVTIICPTHGEFELLCYVHLRGSGCPKCHHDSQRSTKEDFIQKANIVHNNKYLYDKVNYVNNITKVIITCPIHGDFEQTPNSHLNGSECPKCGKKKSISKTKGILKKDKNFYLQKANEIHNNKYDYSKANFTSVKDKIVIICPIHGEFMVSMDKHIHAKVGCPKCKISKGEQVIMNWLENNNINYTFQYKFNIGQLARNSNFVIIDFKVELLDKIIFIEYNGEQHYKEDSFFFKTGGFLELTRRDNVLKEYCNNNNILLLELPYTLTDKQICEKLCEVLL